jgi:dTMP kinase
MLLLEKVFKVINESNLDYCIQNKYEMMPEEIPSDIDMMYRNASEEDLDNLVSKVAKETGLIVTQKICQGYFEYTYIISYPCPQKYFQLQLDFYRAISRRGYLNIMPAEEMLENKRFYKCFYVPDPYIEFKYMWIRRTIKHDMNNEHIEIAKKLYLNNPEKYIEQLKKDFGAEVSSLVLEILDKNDVEIFNRNFEVFNSAAKRISRKNASLPVRLKYTAFMLGTVIPKRIFHKCGLSVAFIAPDGAGKSTIINRVKETVSGSFYGVNLYYMRPHLFKNLGHYNKLNPTEEAATNDNPHGVVCDGVFKSAVRFFFYNLDFQLGTLLKINRKKINKQLVIFDRYYYDYFADMKRYKYSLPAWFPAAFEWMIPKPDMVFVLDGNPEVLYERKKELPISELEKQCSVFHQLAQNRKNFYAINVNRDVDTIVDEVTETILQEMSRRTSRIMK